MLEPHQRVNSSLQWSQPAALQEAETAPCQLTIPKRGSPLPCRAGPARMLSLYPNCCQALLLSRTHPSCLLNQRTMNLGASWLGFQPPLMLAPPIAVGGAVLASRHLALAVPPAYARTHKCFPAPPKMLLLHSGVLRLVGPDFG